jgi:hypothetical protein
MHFADEGVEALLEAKAQARIAFNQTEPAREFEREIAIAAGVPDGMNERLKALTPFGEGAGLDEKRGAAAQFPLEDRARRCIFRLEIHFRRWNFPRSGGVVLAGGDKALFRVRGGERHRAFILLDAEVPRRLLWERYCIIFNDKAFRPAR